jgi:CHAT domain-containing protein
VHDYFETLIDILMRLYAATGDAQYQRSAFDVNERARARSMLDALGGLAAEIGEQVPPDLRKTQRDLVDALAFKSEHRLRLAAEDRATHDAVSVDRDINDLTEKLRIIETQIRTADPRYADLLNGLPYSLEDVQRALDQETTLLEYSLGRDRSYLWVITHKRLVSFQLPPRSKLAPNIRLYNSAIADRTALLVGESAEHRRARLKQIDSHLEDLATQLSSALLGPAADLLKTKRIAIVSDDLLQYVPFAALPLPPPLLPATNFRAQQTMPSEPIVSQYEVVELPSASVWVGGRRHKPKATPTLTIAIFADPVFSLDDTRYPPTQPASAGCTTPRASVSGSPRQHIFDRLLFGADEANAADRYVEKESRLRATDFKANIDQLLQVPLSNYRFVHFGTHGVADSTNVQASGLVLSLINECGQPREGYISLGQIYNLHLAADAVLLTGCKTAIGKVIAGEGLVSVGRAFLYAGARSVIATLWAVNDESTAVFTDQFYRAVYVDKLSPAAALRRAQVWLMQHSPWQSPYYWAPFVLEGDWD